ncbi:putative phenylalanine--tRNA ligase, mitochondrial [Armadillidium nasatum]|uniref:phenylalanine--tRNA ligase n=1 Tax=Armadillidium nasatum TaxID=96803 RepID=A0A5N5SKQ4_9CRUS|nr:putative phenylalanine--tRNA ligase, mitochondrial [Armadillidium nasatum]
MYSLYKNNRGNPLFSVYDQLLPVVNLNQNFDSLLVPKNHVSRQKSDNYYINQNYLLRAHTTAHQTELIQMGLDNFLVVGDVFRRDSIDSSHYPVFHQVDAVRLCSKHDVFGKNITSEHSLFEEREITEDHQSCHSDAAVNFLTQDLKSCLISLATSVFGKDVEWRWVSASFPFTHPSWELEIKLCDKWTEILGCGIIKQDILKNSGVREKVGWAFGLGLERWAMKLYNIPDIRVFWSTDPRFHEQFDFEDPSTPVTFQSYSKQPPCINDISFWLPEEGKYCSEDFYDLVRSIGDDLVEKVELIDDFLHPKKKTRSHCYRITYRSWQKALLQEEANVVHQKIAEAAQNSFGVQLRC